MNDSATAAAIESPVLEDTKIAVRADWSPEVFRQEVQREKEMRTILATYMKEAMIPEHHYYSFKSGDKPAITQEGAHSICSLMKVTIGRPEIEKDYTPDGHLTVTARVDIFNKQGEIVATGDGICSTRESKYAYRWVWDNEVPDGIDVSKLKSKSGEKNNRKWKQYQMPNQDLPDLYNTILKMGVKRAKVAAVRQLPLVSELFVAEPDDGGEPEQRKPNAEAAKPKPQSAPQQQPKPQEQPQFVAKAVELSGKLQNAHGIAFEDLVTQFLPEGVVKFADLTEEQAAEIVPSLVELINSKIGGK